MFMNKSISETISLLRFPLACMIVLKHYYTPDISAETIGGGTLYFFLGELFTNVLTAVPVPLFLMISGYLYFNRITLNDGFNMDTYKRKTKSRLKSLFIPYIIWNLLVLLLFAVCQSIIGNSEVMQKDGYKMIADYDLVDYLKAFWALDSTNYPIDGPLWFIRDLFVVSLFSPIVYLGIKYLKWIFVLIVFGLSYSHIGISFPFVEYTYYVGLAEMYFSLGAGFMLLNPNFLARLKQFNYLIPIGVITVVFAVVLTVSVIRGMGNEVCLQGYRFTGSLLVFGLFAIFVDKGCRVPEWLTTASFFIFAMHKPVQVIVRRLLFTVFLPQNGLLLSSLIFIVPIIVICVCLLAFIIVKRYLPWLKCLNGYRL